ncbi:MAG: hypothetical protein JW940_22930, partial [Polyangiaceae bacterium]|nr:hypothetical protein [Polyangiaceae bacterium]
MSARGEHTALPDLERVGARRQGRELELGTDRGLACHKALHAAHGARRKGGPRRAAHGTTPAVLCRPLRGASAIYRPFRVRAYCNAGVHHVRSSHPGCVLVVEQTLLETGLLARPP